MSDHEQEFQERWDFRRNERDLDSSSNGLSGSSSESETKLKRHKKISICAEENNLSSEEHEKEANQSIEKHYMNKGMKKERKVRPRKPKKMASNQEPEAEASDLSGYMDSLIDGIKVARHDLLKWMSKQMEESINKEPMISSKPNAKGKGQREVSKETQNSKRRTPGSNLSKRRKNQIEITQNCEVGSSEKSSKGKKKSQPISEEVVATDKQKRKRSGSFDKNKKNLCAVDNQTDNYLNLPTVLSEGINPSEDGNDKDNNGKGIALHESSNLSSQLTFLPRTQQKDGVFAQTGLRNVNDYEKNTNLIGTVVRNGDWSGNGNGNGFNFPFSSQGFNGGIEIPNATQFGLQYLTQVNRISGQRMNGGSTRLSSINPGFMENYCTLNPNLRFKSSR